MQYRFDIVGDAAIFETDGKGSDRAIAKEIVSAHPRVKTVYRKAGGREGPYRLRRLKTILGRAGRTLHREYGFSLLLDPRKVYFSPRESTERQRIASLVLPGETVLVMFSGVEPFSIAIAKKQPLVRKVYGIEVNPDCAAFAEENIRANKLGHKVTHMTGDVNKEVPKLLKAGVKLDRVVMPLPETGHEFLGVAFAACKRGGIIHFYSLSSEASLFEEPEALLKDAASRAKAKYSITGRKKVLPFAPRRWKVRLDVKKG
jgi:tRNA (guanine37-N1)-methyltransferase